MVNSINTNPDLESVNRLLFQSFGIGIHNIERESESKEYVAHDFEFNNQNIKFRVAKTTPTKRGLFVALWKRNKKGITEPFSLNDKFDFYIIATRQKTKYGIFIFSKDILCENRIITNNNSIGKRGIRVYPSWTVVENEQAQKTQIWQTRCFIEIKDNNQFDCNKLKELLKIQ